MTDRPVTRAASRIPVTPYASCSLEHRSGPAKNQTRPTPYRRTCAPHPTTIPLLRRATAFLDYVRATVHAKCAGVSDLLREMADGVKGV